VTGTQNASRLPLKEAIKDEASRLGFLLAGFTTPDPPPHASVFESWLAHGRHGQMSYLAEGRSRERRSDPRRIFPNCKSIIVLAAPYSNPAHAAASSAADSAGKGHGRIAAYAWGEDYHLVFPRRMRALVDFIEKVVDQPVANRYYTDTGPVLERDLAQRAGLSWIGKNTCLISPRHGSYFLLAEILLDLELEPDAPLRTDHCGKCTRCMDACPTECILPDRTIDARRCISYLTIELRDDIPEALRPRMGNWIFGCDVCQMVCPWNRFSQAEGDPDFTPGRDPMPALTSELRLTQYDFSKQYRGAAVKRAKYRGHLRNAAVAAGNSGDPNCLPALHEVARNGDAVLREHAEWAISQINRQ
jgi:epoxyqueuosine reductase